MNWDKVALELGRILKAVEQSSTGKPCFGQDKAVIRLMERLKNGGTILADEVGLGKTRVALMIMEAVMNAGGTVAAVVPPGLLYQWENEYNDFISSLQESRKFSKHAKEFNWDKQRSVIKLRSYWNLFEQAGTRFPLNTSKKWLLISHNFGFLYQVSNRTDTWKVELPFIARALHEDENAHGNSRWQQFWKRFNNRPDNYTHNKKIIYEKDWNDNVINAATHILKHSGSLSPDVKKFLFNDMACPVYRNGYYVSDAGETFPKGSVGRKAFHEIIGRLLGPIDLLVIDEAHKSREEIALGADSSNTKRLTSLLQDIMWMRNRNSRCICLTATPIELGASQWTALLQRAGVNLTNIDLNFLSDFENALHQANQAPDQTELLDELVRVSKIFEARLRPHMIRRRRINQDEHLALLEGTNSNQAHPHRELGLLKIEPAELALNWKKAILCLEGVSRAAKGSDSNYSDKLVTYRYGSAMMDLTDHKDDGEPEPESISPDAAKKERVKFWRRLANRHALDGSHKKIDIASHPRVQKTADYIEQCIENNQEKILIFGRFTNPMKALRRELNARCVLRRIDKGIPTTRMRVTIPELFDTYQRLCLKNEADKHYSIRTKWQAEHELNAACETARDDYRKIQEKLRNRFSNDALLKMLPGDACFEKMQQQDEDGLNAVFNRFRGELLENLLESKEYTSLSSTVSDRTDNNDFYESCKNRIIKICADYIRGAHDQNIPGSTQKTTDWEGHKDFQEVDMIGDQMSPDHLYAAMDIGDSERKGRSLPGSAFCRLMDGGMNMSTRRIVQERFNRKTSFPKVLIAQSLVGREGLNLHKACRHLILFHPEWNPAVVEQEIGRVDRIHSLWNQLAKEWQDRRKENNDTAYPKIKVDFVVFKGTYDEYQFNVLDNRRKSLEAQLFGALLDEESMAHVSEAYQLKLINAAPDFEP